MTCAVNPLVDASEALHPNQLGVGDDFFNQSLAICGLGPEDSHDPLDGVAKGMPRRRYQRDTECPHQHNQCSSGLEEVNKVEPSRLNPRDGPGNGNHDPSEHPTVERSSWDTIQGLRRGLNRWR